ncbi:acyl- dehydrogenase family member 11, partial [Paramuricea clavata]
MDTSEVRAEHKFDKIALDKYLARYLRGYPSNSNENLVVRQYRHGQSNPTFYMRKGSQEFVMRKKPPGKLLRHAHQVEREFDFTEALHKVGFPVATPLHLCQDVSVVGTEFYIMEHVQ